MQPFVLEESLESNNIILQRFNMTHAAPLYQFIISERERLSEFLPWPRYIQKVEDEEKFISSMEKSWEDKLCFGYAIVNSHTDEVMGAIDLHAISWENFRGEIGYWIAQKFEGRGYIHEACKRLEQYLFTVGFNRLEIRCNSLNHRSLNIPKRLGYQLEGELREDAMENGHFRNTLIYGLLRRDRVFQESNSDSQ